MVEPMSTQITRNDITDALNEMEYDPEDCTETILLDEDVFQGLALKAHELDITVNALVNALIRIEVSRHEELPSIPGVGTAPFMYEST